MLPPVKKSILYLTSKRRTVLACKWSLICADCSPDSDQTTFSQYYE